MDISPLGFCVYSWLVMISAFTLGWFGSSLDSKTHTHGAFYTRGNETTAVIRVVDMVAEGFDCREACSENKPDRARDESCFAEAEKIVNNGRANTIELPRGICQF